MSCGSHTGARVTRTFPPLARKTGCHRTSCSVRLGLHGLVKPDQAKNASGEPNPNNQGNQSVTTVSQSTDPAKPKVALRYRRRVFSRVVNFRRLVTKELVPPLYARVAAKLTTNGRRSFIPKII